MAKPTLHYHSCTEKDCRQRYPDACDTPTVNDVCRSCRQGRPSVHQIGIDPRPCCGDNLRVANKNDLKTYKLRGPGPWWLCMKCGRQFGYDVRLR